MTDNEKDACFTDNMMAELARDLRKAAYAPYSGYTVGAACRGESGTTYFGCNVENSSFPAGICAERNAVAAAIAHGEKKIRAIAIAGNMAGDDPDGTITPCGVCLQFLSEFMDSSGRIIVADGNNSTVEYTLGELLPHAFKVSSTGMEGKND